MNNQKNSIVFLLAGILFLIVGIAIIFIPSSRIKEALNCDSAGRCSYSTQNFRNEVVTNENFIINEVFEVRKDIVKKGSYQIYYDSRIGSKHTKYNKHKIRKNDKVSTTVYYDVYLSDTNGNTRRIEITTSKMFNEFKKYYENRKRNIIPANSEFSLSNINIFLILGCLFTSLMGLISIITFFKTGNTKTRKPY